MEAERRRLGVCSFQFQLRRRTVQKEAEVSNSCDPKRDHFFSSSKRRSMKVNK